MSSGITCSNCGSSYNTSYIFCPNCNSNLTLPTRITLADVSYKEEIDAQYFEQYQQLEEKLKELDWIDYERQKQQQMLQSLNIEENRLDLEIESWEDRVAEEKADVDALNKMSWASFRAKISGSHDKALKKEEEEYLEAVQQLNDARRERVNIQKRISTVQAELAEIEKYEQARQDLKKKMTDLVVEASEGIVDEKEDEIELAINELAQQLDPLTVRKSRIQTAYSFLQMSAEYIRDAMLRIEEEGERVVQKNALLMDTLTKSDVAELRAVVKEASTFLTQAYEIMKSQLGEDDIDAETGETRGLFQGQNLWEKFMRNFMTDLKKGFQSREETKEQLSKSIGDINKLQSWVNSLLTDINVKIGELMSQLYAAEQDLIKERKRIFARYYGGNVGEL